ncbi:MAG: glutathione peroxidase [Bacteroidetes bacterium]|nr:glutathione peroxidase [Bacteroidota bacterium]
MRIKYLILFLLISFVNLNGQASKMNHNILDITVKDIDGKTFKLNSFKGKTILIVNVASKCGFTPQYEGLQKLYDKYKNKNFVILGFPSNDFLFQETGSDEEIKEFCTTNYAVTFPMFSKISVRGSDQHPLYTFLTSKETNPNYNGFITWNFNKFLIDKNGKITNRFGSKIEPLNQEVISEIEKIL